LDVARRLQRAVAMKNTLLFLFLATGCGPLPVGENEEAIVGGTTGAMSGPQLLTLNVDSFEPAHPVEDRPVFIRFHFSNTTSAVHQGTVRLETANSTGEHVLGNPVSITANANQSVAGMVEIDRLDVAYSGGTNYWLHYYEPSAPYTPAESSPCSGFLPEYGRVEFRIDDVAIARSLKPLNPADLVIQIDTTERDYATLTPVLHSQSQTIAGARAGTTQVPTVKSDLDYPLASEFVQFNATLRWGTQTLAADGQVDLGEFFSYFNYTPAFKEHVTASMLSADTAVERVPRDRDTLPLATYFAQIPTGWGVFLASGASGLNAQILYGGGTIVDSGGLMFDATGVSPGTEVKLLISDATRSSTVYIQVTQ
jgi:hypothetical protein